MPRPYIESLPRRTRCRACNAPLEEILSLGPIALSDFPRAADSQAHPAVPLDLCRCTNDGCTLVQLAHTTPPDWLFKQYWYRSGVNETMVAELQDLALQALRRLPPHPGDTVVDIGANDGTLLQGLAANHLVRIAYEPAANLYEVLRPRAEAVYPNYFREAKPWKAEARAKWVFCVACFYDLEDPHQFLEGITNILHPEGLCVVQQAYLPAMLIASAFDNICHEHLAYHDLHSMEALLEPHGLEVVDVEERTINGGSFRLYIQFAGVTPQTGRVIKMLEAERKAWYRRAPDEAYAAFADNVQAVRRQLQGVLGMYAQQGSVVDLYAASTKANTLLGYCGIDHTLIRQAWERSPEKIGRYFGMSGIPIVSEEAGRADPPAALMVGAWQFKEAFLQREAAYLQAGGRLIFPLPSVETVVGAVTA